MLANNINMKKDVTENAKAQRAYIQGQVEKLNRLLSAGEGLVQA